MPVGVQSSDTTFVRSATSARGNGPVTLGGYTDYSTFESDGTLVAYGAATVWDDVYPSSVAVGSGADPCI